MENLQQKYYKTLELDKVLLLIAELTSCDDSHNAILEINPTNDFGHVTRLLNETDCALSLIHRFGSPTIARVNNPSASCKRAEIGSLLTTKELLRIGEVLRVVRGLVQWKGKCSGGENALDEYFNFLSPNQNLEDKIFTCILSEDEIADSASSELADIRRKIRSAGASARQQLESIIKSSTHAKHLQEQIITFRDGRFVVPVKAEYRNEIKGLVHDTSSSGATVFVEPMAVVEANNKIKLLESEEKKEIERILGEFSNEVAIYSQGIIDSYNCLVEIDVIFAKAKYADRIRGFRPKLSQKGEISLTKARHPLIDRKCVVPINIELGVNFDTLVVTGPNTGGKTVSLKTLGLLTIMTMCGLLIPCDEGSVISIFDKILVDIGDEQSIEQSLSTFSSHMKNIIRIMEHADDRSLILLDELGSGTDPVEGAALAVSIIESLRQKGSFIAATTHYAEIKVFALATKGVENACCEFDITTLSPTYKLLIGVPGRSNAFAISQRLGLSEEVVERAKQKMSENDSQFENVVSSLEQSRVKMEQERENNEKLRLQSEKIKLDAEKMIEKIEQDKEKEIEKARAQAKKLVDQISAKATAIVEELDDIRRKKDNPDFSEMAIKARQELKSKLKSLSDEADPVKSKKNKYVLPRDLKAGDEVLIVDINTKGVVLSPKDNSGFVQIQAGIIKTKVNVDNLKLLNDEEKQKKQKSTVSRTMRNATATASSEISLRGMNAEEAIMELDRFIDNCVLGNIHTIRIVHGKGTGVLRSAVQVHLRKHKNIRTFRLGVYGEGENGVTIAEIK